MSFSCSVQRASSATTYREVSSSMPWMRTGFLTPATVIAKWQTSPCQSAPGCEASQRKRACLPPPVCSTRTEHRSSPRSASSLRITGAWRWASWSRRPSAMSVSRMSGTDALGCSRRMSHTSSRTSEDKQRPCPLSARGEGRSAEGPCSFAA